MPGWRQRRPNWLGCDNAGNTNIGGLFLAREQDFMQTFTGTNAREIDFDVSTRLKAAQLG